MKFKASALRCEQPSWFQNHPALFGRCLPAPRRSAETQVYGGYLTASSVSRRRVDKSVSTSPSTHDAFKRGVFWAESVALIHGKVEQRDHGNHSYHRLIHAHHPDPQRRDGKSKVRETQTYRKPSADTAGPEPTTITFKVQFFFNKSRKICVCLFPVAVNLVPWTHIVLSVIFTASSQPKLKVVPYRP